MKFSGFRIQDSGFRPGLRILRGEEALGMRMLGKTAVVTGGGSGIGEAIVRRFAREGAKVAIFDRDTEAVERVRGLVVEEVGEALAVGCDVSDEESVRVAVGEVQAAFGGIDVLVNNAGIAHIGNVGNTGADDFDRVFSVNVRGVFLCMREVIEGMLERGCGAILNMASVASKLGIQDRFAYSMSKGAVMTMTLSVARDYVDKGIRCNCICPARVHTPFVDGFLAKNYPGEEAAMFEKLEAAQPIGRMGKPEEIASLALFLCSDEAAFITGSAYDIDGGFTLLR